MRLIAEHPAFMVAVALVIGATITFIRYGRLAKKDHARWLVLTLAILRGLTVFLIALLLFSPWLIRQTNEVKKPLLVLLQDKSSSMAQSLEGAKLVKEWPAIRQKFINVFKSDADVKVLDFSDKLYDSLTNAYSGNSTALDQPLTDVLSRFSDANLGAVVIMSDGIYNRGSHPLVEASKLRIPVYGILAGDTVPSKDLAIGGVRNNEVVFVGNQFTIEFGLKAEGFVGGVNTYFKIVEIKSDGIKSLLKEAVKINGYDRVLKNLPAETKGLHHYRIIIEGVQGERNLKNNQRDFYVEVVDTKSKVLLWAQSPHPDLSAIRQAIINHPQYEIDAAFSFGNRPDFSQYSLIIAHNLPVSQEQKALFQSLISEGKSIWFIGARTNFSLLNGLQSSLKALPNSALTQFVNAQPSGNFTAFGLPPGLISLLNDLPPLEAPDLSFTGINGLEVALKQQIGQVATPFPLLAFSTSGKGRLGFLVGEGLWLWRISAYEKNTSHEAFDELIRKAVQFLLVREDTRPLRVWHDKNLYESTEDIQFGARLLNKSLEPVLDADIKLEVESTAGVKYRFRLLPDQQGYSISIGTLPKGSYRWNATTSLGKEILKTNGAFEVRETDFEGLETTARHDVLRQLAQATGASTAHWTQAQSLVDSIKNSPLFKPVYITETASSPLAQWWPLLLLIGVFLSSEWLLARFHGLD